MPSESTTKSANAWFDGALHLLLVFGKRGAHGIRVNRLCDGAWQRRRCP